MCIKMDRKWKVIEVLKSNNPYTHYSSENQQQETSRKEIKQTSNHYNTGKVIHGEKERALDVCNIQNWRIKHQSQTLSHLKGSTWEELVSHRPTINSHIYFFSRTQAVKTEIQRCQSHFYS